MTIAKARHTIYFLWGGSFVIIILLLELAPAIRRGAVAPSDAHDGLMKMAALFTPVLTAFASFWYRGGQSDAPRRISRQRWLPAITTNVVFLSLILILLVYAAYIEPYEDVNPDLTFNDWITNIMQIGLLLSPVVVAPVAYLLGVERQLSFMGQ